MLLAEYCRLMARYNTWQNASLVTAADGLTNVDRWKDRGAFFQSISVVTNHVHHFSLTFVASLMAEILEALTTSTKMEITNPLATGAGILNRERNLIRFTRNSPSITTGMAAANRYQGEYQGVSVISAMLSQHKVCCQTSTHAKAESNPSQSVKSV